MRLLCASIYFLVGLVNLAPILGVAGRKTVEALYGASIASPELVFLMQHRALMFGIVGGLLIVAVFKPALRTLAIAVSLYSMGSFILLYVAMGVQSPALLKVCIIDAVAALLLVSARCLEKRPMALIDVPSSANL